MRAYIYYHGTKGDGYSGPGAYSLVTEDKRTLYHRWCTNRAFANHDLTVGVESVLRDSSSDLSFLLSFFPLYIIKQ